MIQVFIHKIPIFLIMIRQFNCSLNHFIQYQQAEISRMQSKNSTEIYNQMRQWRQQLQVKSKETSQLLPLFILPDHRIIVYTNSPIYRRIYHHLKAICEPLLRPKTIHEYVITKFSLYTAMVLNYTGEQIVEILKKLSRNVEFPAPLESQILQYMKHAGQARLSLINGQYYIFTTESISILLAQLIEKVEDITIKQLYDIHLAQVSQEMEIAVLSPSDIDNKLQIQLQDDIVNQNQNQEIEMVEVQVKKKGKIGERILGKYRIIGDYFQVAKRLIQNNIPLVQQFDFQACQQLESTQMDMNSDVQLRFYQEAALKNVFIDGKARSGLIILPCGAGKSMVAIQIIQRIKKRAVIFCQNQTSAFQWRDQLIRWTTIERGRIVVLTSKSKSITMSQLENCWIFITTYSMVGLKRERENKMLEKTQSMAWGICVADEVHKLPADTFQLVLRKYRFYLKIGLTATPYRQDKKIDNLYFMVGPKLYEENWLDLVNQGCLAKPYCVQLLCPMPEIFKEAYNRLNRPQLLHTANPTKFQVLQYLIRKHSHFGDKILVFCDRPKVLQRYARLLGKPFIHGGVSEEERLHFYGAFKTIKQFNVLFLSRVGDTAIDLPCANVGIQLGMHYKSRRQQVQRMGRIMRPKDNPFNQFNAFFYTLVSEGTQEVEYCRQRHKVLIDQGFQHEIKLASELDYSGLRIQGLDHKDHLLFVLSEHQEGGSLLDHAPLYQNRKATALREANLNDDEYYYEENDDDD